MQTSRGGKAARARACAQARQSGSTRPREWQRRTCVSAPANAPPVSSAVLESVPRYIAASERPKKAAPVQSMMSGVASAAVPQPRYSKTNLPESMSAMVA
jgi:hypothetical protein